MKNYFIFCSIFVILFQCVSQVSAGTGKPNINENEIELLKDELSRLKETVEKLQEVIEKQQSVLEKLQNEKEDKFAKEKPNLSDGNESTTEAKAKEKEDKGIEAEIAKVLSEEKSSIQPLYSTKIGDSTLKLMDISFDSLFSMGTSTARESEIDKLHGGSHDPVKRGFTTQNLEFSMLGAIDPYLNGEAHLIFQIDKEGKSELEVEEAFLTTQSLPYGLQIKAGTYFTEFGRLNPQHPHTWAFVDQPVINTRLFGGDGLRGPGARLSWLTPLSWYSEIFGGVQNANGETAFSFLNEEGEDFSGYTLKNREVKSLEDMLYSTHWLNSFSLSDELTLNVGASALFGPNATGDDNKTNIYGTDIYLKWTPLTNDRGFPFVAWQTEFMKRDYEAGKSKKDLDDWGLYSHILWGFKKNWVSGLRYDFADGDGAPNDYLRDRRYRISPNLTWYPTEFSKLRLQYNYDKAEHINGNDGEEHSAWLQFEFMLGSHPKHKL